ncbi:MAG: VPLPA-CTERM sorting domain-containing protein [Geobacteraceae bacterium]|nr:VPLPA-CTERM sorting domain-containing protein [Geobacteraceae bacterium]
MERTKAGITSYLSLLLASMLFVMGFSNLSYASTTIYTNESSFLSAINSDYYLENFPGWVFGAPLDSAPLTYNSSTVNGYSWQASAPSGLYSLDNGISTWYGGDPLIINFTGNPVTAVGAVFAATSDIGSTRDENIGVLLNDNTGYSFTGSSFVGFVSTTPITSLTVGVSSGTTYPAAYHFYTGSAAPVPIPAAAWLLGSGLMGLVGMKRRFFRA